MNHAKAALGGSRGHGSKRWKTCDASCRDKIVVKSLSLSLKKSMLLCAVDNSSGGQTREKTRRIHLYLSVAPHLPHATSNGTLRFSMSSLCCLSLPGLNTLVRDPSRYILAQYLRWTVLLVQGIQWYVYLLPRGASSMQVPGPAVPSL